MRCPSCNKFVSNGDPDVELGGDEELNDRSVTGTVRVVIPCAECGEELKDAELEYDVELDHVCDEEDEDEDEDPELELQSVDAEPMDRYETVGKNGKALPARAQTHYYGATITVKATCSRCGKDVTGETTVEEAASAMNELV